MLLRDCKRKYESQTVFLTNQISTLKSQQGKDWLSEIEIRALQNLADKRLRQVYQGRSASAEVIASLQNKINGLNHSIESFLVEDTARIAHEKEPGDERTPDTGGVASAPECTKSSDADTMGQVDYHSQRVSFISMIGFAVALICNARETNGASLKELEQEILRLKGLETEHVGIVKELRAQLEESREAHEIAQDEHMKLVYVKETALSMKQRQLDELNAKYSDIEAELCRLRESSSVSRKNDSECHETEICLMASHVVALKSAFHSQSLLMKDLKVSEDLFAGFIVEVIKTTERALGQIEANSLRMLSPLDSLSALDLAISPESGDKLSYFRGELRSWEKTARAVLAELRQRQKEFSAWKDKRAQVSRWQYVR